VYKEAPGFRPGPRGVTRARTRGDRAVLPIVYLKCDELLSNVAFNFNVRRYTVVQSASPPFPSDAVLELLGGGGGGDGISVHGITHFVDGSNVTLDQW
jgi:hypothetical protein